MADFIFPVSIGVSNRNERYYNKNIDNLLVQKKIFLKKICVSVLDFTYIRIFEVYLQKHKYENIRESNIDVKTSMNIDHP